MVCMPSTGKEPWTQYNDVSGHAESVSSDTSTPLEMQPSDSPEPTYKTNESGAYYASVCLLTQVLVPVYAYILTWMVLPKS